MLHFGQHDSSNKGKTRSKSTTPFKPKEGLNGPPVKYKGHGISAAFSIALLVK
jgi:hypothetical protein